MNQHDAALQRINEVVLAIISSSCNCSYLQPNESQLACSSQLKGAIVYRATLLRTDSLSASSAAGIVRNWITSSPIVNMFGDSVQVDSGCLTIVSPSDSECFQGMGGEEEDPTLPAWSWAVIAIVPVLFIVAILVVAILVFLCCCRKKGKYR